MQSMSIALGALGATLLFVGAAAWSQEQESSGSAPTTIWEGRWMNRKYNTSGPLKCTASKRGGTTMQATFTGQFMGEGFKYEVEFQAVPNGARQQLRGTAVLDGDRYQWKGHAEGNRLVGQFESLKGNNGTFQLRRVEANSPPRHPR